MSVDLSTKYLGIPIANPLLAAASPVTANLESLQQLEAAGVAAVVLPSLFAEQIEQEEAQVHKLYEHQTESFAEALDYFPEMVYHPPGAEQYLSLVAQAKQALNIPVIASLNGTSVGTWTRYAQAIQDAGADALELNIFFVPTDARQTAKEVERRYIELVASVRQSTTLPLAVKVGPFFSSMPGVARELVDAGAQGLVLFNRYLEPDVDIEQLAINPNLVLSDRHELRLPLRWIATLRDQLDVSLAASGGAHFSEDVIKALLAGADVVMAAAALIRYGPSWLTTILDEVRHWLANKEYESVQQIKGSMSVHNYSDPRAYLRANYMRALTSYSTNLY
jgi:dihydroorotate dehydrogenase (fumarate)